MQGELFPEGRYEVDPASAGIGLGFSNAQAASWEIDVFHLAYSERFTVTKGRLIVEIDGVRHELGPGDQAVAAPGSLHAWSNPGQQRSVAHVELRPGSPGFERSLRIVYGLAADGLVLKNGVPRNPLHAALLLEMGEVRLPGAYAALERVMALLARLARRRGIDRELERRYL